MKRLGDHGPHFEVTAPSSRTAMTQRDPLFERSASRHKRKGKGKKDTVKRGSKKVSKTLRADVADKYDLYQRSVQAADIEVKFFRKQFKKIRGRKAISLREDFCGTAWVCAEWLKKKDTIAYGVDLDPEPIAWGKERHFSKLTDEQRSRMSFLQANVLDVEVPPVDIISAQNFSFFIFHERDVLVDYFRSVRRGLNDEGILLLDMFGGPECMQDDEVEKKRVEHPDGDFDYVWTQETFEPIHNNAVYSISFHFDDGSKMKRAFSYDWRMWSIAEVRDALKDAGFSESIVYWEGPGKDGEGDGKYKPAETAPPDLAWVSYIIAKA